MGETEGDNLSVKRQGVEEGQAGRVGSVYACNTPFFLPLQSFTPLAPVRPTGMSCMINCILYT